MAKKLTIVALDPEPPEGEEVFYCNEKGQPCKPADAHMFTWTQAPQWYRIKKPVEQES